MCVSVCSNTWFCINGHDFLISCLHLLKVFDRDDYCGDYSDPVYGKIDVDWYYSPIYDIIW